MLSRVSLYNTNVHTHALNVCTVNVHYVHGLLKFNYQFQRVLIIFSIMSCLLEGETTSFSY